MMEYELMVYLFKMGAMEWTFAGSYVFQHIVNTYGSDADKVRLDALNVGYRYRASSELTLSELDSAFLRACGISTDDSVAVERIDSEDGTQRLMQEHNIPMTRENYLRLAFMGNPPAELDGEVESEIPDEFSRED